MKKLLSVSIIFCVFVLTVMLACKKDKENKNYTDATIVWSGMLAVDGCEWQIVIDNNYYKSSNLPKEFEIDNLKVKLIYEEDTEYKYYCGDYPIPQKAIKIIEIKKR
ncbi:MAG: hypothetical protein LBN27_07825 [Prevotellaceae bacterium]|jgi:hypothetical protein|nr:hypothetical protein [Prevotellaceae bacterium]